VDIRGQTVSRTEETSRSEQATRKGPTTRKEQILDAAMAIADEHGLDAVSMRAVAERIGVTAMALYPHVRSKAALLDDMLGRLFASLVQPTADGGRDWRQQLRDLAYGAREMAHRHPWAASLVFSRPSITPEAVRPVDYFYGILLQAGVPPSEVPRLERLLSTFVLGYAASETGGRFGRAEINRRTRGGVLPAGELPAHAALARWLEQPVDWDAEFDADLNDLQRLIEGLIG
jgi:AcrR family transcriptional regulator